MKHNLHRFTNFKTHNDKTLIDVNYLQIKTFYFKSRRVYKEKNLKKHVQASQMMTFSCNETSSIQIF